MVLSDMFRFWVCFGVFFGCVFFCVCFWLFLLVVFVSSIPKDPVGLTQNRAF